MKHLKLLTFACLALIGISLSSCLNSDSSSTQQVAAVVKVYSSYGNYVFKTGDGYTITPTYASVVSCEANGMDISGMVGEVAYIVYTADGLTVDETTKTLDGVTLVGGVSLNSTVEIVEGKASDGLENDSIENAPIVSLEANSSSPAFMDASTLLLPVQYNVTQSENYVTLVYYTDEPEDNGDVLRLHLRYHSKGTSIDSSYTSYQWFAAGYVGLYLKAYDLSGVYFAYISQNGTTTYPTKVQIVTNENSYSQSLDDALENVYTVEYTSSSSD